MFAEINREARKQLPFVLNTVGTARQKPLSRPDGNSFHQFIWVRHGCGSFRLRDEHYTLGVDEGAFIRAGVPHSYEGEDLQTMWLTFTGADGLLDFCEAGDYFTFHVPAWLNEANEGLMRELTHTTSIVARSGKGYALAAELLDVIFSERASTMHRVRQYLESHYADPLSLDDIAAIAGLDRYALCRRYQIEYNCSVMADLCRIRIAKAKQFLRYSGDSVEEIGRLCGFQSPSYFAKRFREACGRTPREYRRAHNR
ncbi:MAG: helix-turn-helix transcriptional regulator [Clostridia bacterium]|nr:helix-turn-helix transcriptional regulator [Clostridia bacterium]